MEAKRQLEQALAVRDSDWGDDNRIVQRFGYDFRGGLGPALYLGFVVWPLGEFERALLLIDQGNRSRYTKQTPCHHRSQPLLCLPDGSHSQQTCGSGASRVGRRRSYGRTRPAILVRAGDCLSWLVTKRHLKHKKGK